MNFIEKVGLWIKQLITYGQMFCPKQPVSVSSKITSFSSKSSKQIQETWLI